MRWFPLAFLIGVL